MDNKTKIVGSIVAGAALIAAGFAGGAVTTEPVTVEKIVEKPVEVIKTVEVTKEVPVEVVKTVTVENTEKLQLVCDRLMYEDIVECVEEVDAENVALKLALDEIKKEIAEELEDAGIVADEKDVRLVKLFTDFEDVEVSESDFDSDEYEFVITAKVEDEDEDRKFNVLITVEVEDGEAKIVDIEEA